MSEINALTLQLLKNKKLSTWSTELENYFTKNLQIRDFTNPTKREEIRRYVKAKFQEKHTPLARTLEEKPLLIYLAIERARMQRDNRNYDKNGNFIGFKKTAKQKEIYAQKGNFNTVLTKEFGNENGGKFQLGTETISFTDGDIGFGVVQGRNAKPVFMPTFAGMTFSNARTWKGKYQGHPGTYFDASDPDCLNGTRGFIPDKTEYTIEESTPAQSTQVITPAQYEDSYNYEVIGGRASTSQAVHNDFSAVVNAMQIGLGATVGRYSFTRTVTETIKPYREVETNQRIERRSNEIQTEKYVRDITHTERNSVTTTAISESTTKGPVKNVEVSRDTSTKDVVVSTDSGVKRWTTDRGETVETIVTHDQTVATNKVIKEIITPIIIPEPQAPVINNNSKAHPIPEQATSESGGAPPVINLNNELEIELLQPLPLL